MVLADAEDEVVAIVVASEDRDHFRSSILLVAEAADAGTIGRPAVMIMIICT